MYCIFCGKVEGEILLVEISDNGQVAILLDSDEKEFYTIKIFDSIKMQNSWEFTIKGGELLKDNEEIQ